MKAIYLHTIGAIAVTFSLAACIPASEAPAPTPPPVVRPAPTPTPAPQPVVQEPAYDSYLDAPQTAGTWEYEDRGNLTMAVFNGPQAGFAIHCFRPNRRMNLIASKQPVSAGGMMQIQTETTTRALPTSLGPGEVWAAIATISANDPLLDAMAITKGRFAVGIEGGRTMYLPAWVEVSRVIEDCR